MNVAQVLKDCCCFERLFMQPNWLKFLQPLCLLEHEHGEYVCECVNEWVWIEFVYTKPTQTSFWAVDQTVRNFNWNQLANW